MKHRKHRNNGFNIFMLSISCIAAAVLIFLWIAAILTGCTWNGTPWTIDEVCTETAHVHNIDECELVCEVKVVLPEDAHVHTTECYREVACDIEEHTHTEACEVGALLCNKIEAVAHEHSTECYNCDVPVHVHGEDCRLICKDTNEEHVHDISLACYGKKIVAIGYSWIDNLVNAFGEGILNDGMLKGLTFVQNLTLFTCIDVVLLIAFSWAIGDYNAKCKHKDSAPVQHRHVNIRTDLAPKAQETTKRRKGAVAPVEEKPASTVVTSSSIRRRH